MIRFVKANIASWLATGLDFTTTTLLYNIGCKAVFSSVSGSICGGILHFLLCKKYVFRVMDQNPHYQLARYGVTWVCNLALNAAGVYILTEQLGMHYLVSKIISSVLLFAGFNYPMYKHFVFKTVR